MYDEFVCYNLLSVYRSSVCVNTCCSDTPTASVSLCSVSGMDGKGLEYTNIEGH